MFDLLESCLQNSIADKANLIQFRGQKRLMTVCTVKNGIIDDYSTISLGGVGTRALIEGKSWGFSSTSVLEKSAVTDTLIDAIKLSQSSEKLTAQRNTIDPSQAIIKDISMPIRKPFQDHSVEELVKIPMDACKGAKKGGKEIADISSTFITIEDNKYFVSSEESRIHQKLYRVLLFVNAVAKRNGDLVPASENIGYGGGLEAFDSQTPFELGEEVGKKAVALLDANVPPSGEFEVVIHPTLCATLLHEAIGHPLEADLAMAGGGFSDRIGEIVSSELVTIYDDGHIEGGLGSFPFDDEGIECNRTELIKNGVLKSYLHDRTSASLIDDAPTGNSHAWDYSVEPLIRQTNIGIAAGDFSQEEMIEGIKEGMLLQGSFGGQANVNGDFTFGFQEAQKIENGILTQKLRGANVAGNAIEVFKTIDAVGNKSILRPGACGKGQFAIQGRIVPAIKCKILVGGTGGK
jgi:TldD protein